MATVEQMQKRVDTNWLANSVFRAFKRRKLTENVRFCGRTGREGVGVLWEGVKVEIGDDTYLITVRKLNTREK